MDATSAKFNHEYDAIIDKGTIDALNCGDFEVVEKIILDEAALETAYEGNRFPDLVRVARRMNDLVPNSGNAYMQAVQQGKYELNGRTNPYTDEASWFMPIVEE